MREIMRRFLYLSALLCLIPHAVWATCSGSGLTWSCTSGSTASQINTAISSASNEATITLANGTYSSAGIQMGTRNGLTLICASVGGCTMSGGTGAIQISSTAHLTNLMRISGFVFSSTSSAPDISVGYISGDPWLDKLRIDHCTFNNTSAIGIGIGSQEATHPTYGVIDHNTFQGSTHSYPIGMLSSGNVGWDVPTLGTANNIFVEDNIFNYASENVAASGQDMWSRSMVFRHNSVTNARTSVHGVCHGGPANLEIYGNTYTGGTGSGDGYRIMHHQGSGVGMWFNNTLIPEGAFMSIQYYRSTGDCGYCDGNDASDGNRSPASTYKGYPCYRQPARDYSGKLTPWYLWNNALPSGNIPTLEIAGGAGSDPNLVAYHLVANRDIYVAVSKNAQTSPTSPFNGTTGMGWGTLANRPTTCTTTTESADAGNGGVGYFATDQGSQGTLYVCTATNTWSVYYQPYTYPHPLVSGGSGDTTPPTVTAFSLPSTYTALTVPITTFTASDDTAVTGYCLNESATPPTSSSCSGSGWAGSAQTNFVFFTAGVKTLYAWAKDAAGNISSSASGNVTITLSGAVKYVPWRH